MSKTLDAILGFSIGDAMGVPIEFTSRHILNQHKLTEMVGFGSHQVPEGTWSDDTSMVLATMDSIIENQAINCEDMMQKYCEWYKNAKYTATDKLFDIGGATQISLSNYINYHMPLEKCGQRSINSNGNGSLMRILPVSLFLASRNLSEQEETFIVNSISELTHGHEISMLGCKIYTDYVKSLLQGKTKQQAYQSLKEKDYSKYYSDTSIDAYYRILQKDISKFPEEQINSSGYVVDSLEACLWSFLNNDNYESSVVTAINLGDDTDTIGALTGALSGIMYGVQQIPERWMNKLKKEKKFLIYVILLIQF